MNNRGQSLITFVLVIPIVLLILFMVYDIGSMVLLKEKLDNINYLTIDYGLSHLDTDNLDIKLNDMIKKNKSDIDTIIINVSDNDIEITLKDKLTNKISLINKFDVLDVKSKYVGHVEEDKKIIRKDK